MRERKDKRQPPPWFDCVTARGSGRSRRKSKPISRGVWSWDTGVLLGAQGQDAEGHAFVQIVRGNAEATGDVQVDFVALTRSGRRLERSGFHESGSAQVFTMRFTFDVPLAEVKTFECRERPVRLFESKLVLRP